MHCPKAYFLPYIYCAYFCTFQEFYVSTAVGISGLGGPYLNKGWWTHYAHPIAISELDSWIFRPSYGPDWASQHVTQKPLIHLRMCV